MKIIGEYTFDQKTLCEKYPPITRIFNSKKKAVCRHLHENLNEYPYEGEVRFIRTKIENAIPPWEDEKIQNAASDSFSSVVNVPFKYPDSSQTVHHWHPNFADKHLFGYYGGNLLAQDELQVLEHPILGSIREAIVNRKHFNLPEGVRALTVDPKLGATPGTCI